MSFFAEFFLAFFYNPIKALEALFWYLLRKRVRARNRLHQITAKTPHVYRLWIERNERQDKITGDASQTIACWTVKPLVTIIMAIDVWADAEMCEAAVRAIEMQYYGNWELLLIGGSEQKPQFMEDRRIRFLESPTGNDVAVLNQGIAAAKGSFVFPLLGQVFLAPSALFQFVKALQANPGAQILYGDHDQLDRRGRRTTPWFKPRWNREMFLSQDFLSHACFIEADLARQIAPIPAELAGAASFALLLEATVSVGRVILHIPHIVAHLPEDFCSDNAEARLQAASRHLKQFGATVSVAEFGLLRVRWPLPKILPTVSILIPTRDKVELLKNCINSLLRNTEYGRYEIIVIDNGSEDRKTFEYFSEISINKLVSVIEYQGNFNFSAINNFAASMASGEYICLLNNDTEVVSTSWLSEMMRYAVKAEIGAVGAKLLYPDKSIQHAGVVIGLGDAAGHAHRNLNNSQPGYFLQAHVAHTVSAVTAACLLVAKHKFLAVGGLDAENLKVAFNDVDFCLKLGAAGWQNVYVPQAVLFHHESKSRGNDLSSSHIKRYKQELSVLQTRWKTPGYADPLHHPSLDRSSEVYVIKI